MYLNALMVRPMLATLVTLKMMQLTLEHGLSFISPLAFAMYGMLCVRTSDIDSAFRFGDLGLELLVKLQVCEYIPRVYAAYYGCIYPWRFPIRDALDHLLYAHRVGMQTGDIEYSCLCAYLWSSRSTSAGFPLDKIEDQRTKFQITMKSRRQESLLRMSTPHLQAIRYYRGMDADMDETDSMLQFSIANNLQATSQIIYWSKAQTALLFNDLDCADELACVADLSKNLVRIPPTPELAHITFLNGMIAFAMLGGFGNGKPRRTRRQYKRDGKSMLKSLKSFAQWCPANFGASKQLLEAELAAVNGQVGLAMECYVCAIALAKDNGNLFIQALANERAGRYCFHSLCLRQTALSYFKHSLLAYTSWAAMRKVDHLREELKSMYGTDDYERCCTDETLASVN
jgi:hypothetical protein